MEDSRASWSSFPVLRFASPLDLETGLTFEPRSCRIVCGPSASAAMRYAAKRLDLSRYQLTRDEHVFAEIRMATRMWPCKGTISEGCGNSPEHFPFLDLEGKSYKFLRELSNPKDFHPNHRVWTDLEDGSEKITAQCPPGKICTLGYQGRENALQSDARFSYKFRLLQGQDVLVTFRETSKFWTFSAKKDYGLEVATEIDPMLLSFAFFITICRTY